MVDRPNILWIMADQHNAKCTSWGRFPEQTDTPNLERLANSGVRFDSAHSQNPICTPSRVSYLTGRYPSNHRYYGLGSDIRRQLPTVFSWAADRGYRTGAFGKIHTPDGLIEGDVDELSDHRDHGEYLDERGLLGDRDGDQLPEFVEKVGEQAPQALDARPSRLPFEHHFEHWAADRTKSFVADGNEPFCAWLSFSRPHQVFAPAREFWERYPDADSITLPPSVEENADAAGKPPHHATPDRDEHSWWAVFDPPEHEAVLRRKLRGYLGCISEIDALVGQMLSFLEEAGLREDTIVIYSADHGDFAAEHGFLEKAPGISYDAITRVPFIWSWPGTIEAGQVCSDLVETIDLFPTIRSMVDGDPGNVADGHDLSGLLTGIASGPEREYVVTENPWARTIRTDTQKLTYYPAGFCGEDSEEFLEFYDLVTDPWERENLAEQRPEAVERHRRLLIDHLTTRHRPFTVHPMLSDAMGQDKTLSPKALREALAELTGHNHNYL